MMQKGDKGRERQGDADGILGGLSRVIVSLMWLVLVVVVVAVAYLAARFYG